MKKEMINIVVGSAILSVRVAGTLVGMYAGVKMSSFVINKTNKLFRSKKEKELQKEFKSTLEQWVEVVERMNAADKKAMS